MKNNPGVWFEIYVSDMTRAKKFYESVFQTELKPLSDPTGGGGIEMWSFPGDMTSMGASGALCKMEGYTPGAGGTLIYFSCQDCSVEEGRAARAGGKVVKSKTSLGPHGAMSLVADTEGNLIGLHSMA